MPAWHIFACFASAYFMSYALRAVNAVIAPDLRGYGESTAPATTPDH